MTVATGTEFPTPTREQIRAERARDRAQRGPATLVATFQPGSPTCSCPSCPDTTHGGQLGTADEWTWH